MSFKLPNDEKVYLIAGGTPTSAEEWRFFTHNGQESIQGQNNVLMKLLPLCDGKKTFKEIQKFLGGHVSPEALEALVILLFEKAILVSSSRMYDGIKNYFCPVGNFNNKRIGDEEIQELMNSPVLPPVEGLVLEVGKIPPSTLGALTATRCTTYTFGEKALTYSQLSNLFWSMYGRQGQFDERLSQGACTIPSGGALYSLRFDLFLFRGNEKMARGHYLWRSAEHMFELMPTKNIDQIERSIFDPPPTNLERETGAFVISANLNRTSNKYGNKALPLSYLEAGHAMQNGYLFSSQENLGFAEIFGFKRPWIESIINTGDFNYFSLISGVFGTSPTP